MLIGKQDIARLVPHAGVMCLLDGVLDWAGERIRCVATSHLSADNPLRHQQRLGILAGVEYAAQAMALHGALSGTGKDHAGSASAGFLASLRAVRSHTDRLDLLPSAMIIEAERLHGDTGRAIYRFALSHQDQILLSGRAAVVLQGITA